MYQVRNKVHTIRNDKRYSPFDLIRDKVHAVLTRKNKNIRNTRRSARDKYTPYTTESVHTVRHKKGYTLFDTKRGTHHMKRKKVHAVFGLTRDKVHAFLTRKNKNIHADQHQKSTHRINTKSVHAVQRAKKKTQHEKGTYTHVV